MGDSGKAILYVILFNIYFFLPFLFYSGEGMIGCSLAGFAVTMFVSVCTEEYKKIGYYPLFKAQLYGAGAFDLAAICAMVFKDVDAKSLAISCLFYSIVYPVIALIGQNHIRKNNNKKA